MSEPAVESWQRGGLHLSWAARTDIGKVRRLNEDSMMAEPGVFAVADGMGGHAAGDVASRLTIATCQEGVDSVPMSLQQVEQLVASANRRVRDHSITAGTEGMGTTLVGLVLLDNGGDDGLVVVNVGDSRCYGFNDNDGLVRLTRDHSVVQELVDAGTISEDEAGTHPERNVVTRAIGIEDSVAADFLVLPRHARQRLLLCSDGVCGQLDDRWIGACLAQHTDAGMVVDALIAEVLEGPAPDNATAIVIDVEWEYADPFEGGEVDEDVTGPRPAPPPAAGLIDSVPWAEPPSMTDQTADTAEPISEVPT